MNTSLKEPTGFYKDSLFNEVYELIGEYCDDAYEIKDKSSSDYGNFFIQPLDGRYRWQYLKLSQMHSSQMFSSFTIVIDPYKDGCKDLMISIRFSSVVKFLAEFRLNKNNFFIFCLSVVKIINKITQECLHSKQLNLDEYYSFYIEFRKKHQISSANYASNKRKGFIQKILGIIHLYKEASRVRESAIKEYLDFSKSTPIKDVEKKLNQYSFKFYSTYFSKIINYSLNKKQYDYWKSNTEEFKVYIAGIMDREETRCKGISELINNNNSRYFQFIQTMVGKSILKKCRPFLQNSKGKFIHELLVPSWAKSNSWMPIESNIKSGAGLNSELSIFKNGEEIHQLKLKDIALEDSIKLLRDPIKSNTNDVCYAQINIYLIPFMRTYYFDLYGELDLKDIELHGSMSNYGDLIVSEISHKDCINIKTYQANSSYKMSFDLIKNSD